MDLSRRDLFELGAAAMAGSALGGETAGPAPTPDRRSLHADDNLTIRGYLCREASRITNGALRDLKSRTAFQKQQPNKRRDFLEMMGLAERLQGARSRVPVHVTGVVERPGFRIEKLSYESLPDLHVTANLYVPAAPISHSRFPGVLYVCGHAANQKHHYQAHARRFAQLGFVCLIAETVQLGEVAGYHHGCYREGWFHWYSRGYSPAATELYNGIRGLDLLAERADVDPARLGVTGISGGGASTWWIAAGDERVAAAAPVCGTTTLESHIYDRVIDGHCDCMWWPNSLQWDLADVGALIAPLPLLIASADRDGIFPIGSIRKVHSQLEGLYGRLGKAEMLKLVETPGGHSYHEKSRTAIFSWFLKHLAGKDVTPRQVGDIDTANERPESLETLRVFVSGPPARNRTATIHEEFIPIASPPKITDRASAEAERKRLTAALRKSTFAAFPSAPPPLDVVEEFARDGGTGSRFAFTSEAGWRLHGLKMTISDPPALLPGFVVLRSPGEDRNAAEQLSGRLQQISARIVVEPRGTGETAWGDELNWHLRHAAAWTGRTIASMRVWDALRALDATRKLTGVDSKRVVLVASGEMCAVALYAALLDENVLALVLHNPPASQNEAGRPDGRGPAIEMLHCLRFTDLPYVAGLLSSPQLVLAGDVPKTYDWTVATREKLGSPVLQVRDVGDWTPI